MIFKRNEVNKSSTLIELLNITQWFADQDLDNNIVTFKSNDDGKMTKLDYIESAVSNV